MESMVLEMRKMKDSGIEWIGEIPEGWSVSKVLHCLSMPITDGPHTTPILYDTGIPFVSAEAVSCGNGRIDFSHIRGYISEKFYKECCQKYIPEIDDIYMIKSGATTGRVAIVDTTRVFTIWSPLAVFRCNKDCILPKFLFYYLQSPAFQKEVEFGWTFGTQQNVGMRSLEQMKVCVPQLNKQDTIANYLDYQCTQIDLLLQKALTSIDEYKKLKQAVITQAVTKGVRGKREMKDSGVEWVSHIPVDWNTIKLKYCTYIRARLGWRALKADEYVESGFPFLSAFNIVNNALHFTNLNYINQFRYDESPEIQLKVGDVLLVKDGAGIGKCAIVENMPIPSTVNGSIAVISSTSFITPKYLYYYFLSEMFQQHIDLLKDGMGVPHLFQSDLKEIKIAFPSKDEQKEIADYLDAKCAEIDGLIAKKEKLVKELESYKKSLIYEVVTGKREV